MVFELENGHSLLVRKAERGLENDYEVSLYEEGVLLFSPEYYTKEAIEGEYGIKL